MSPSLAFELARKLVCQRIAAACPFRPRLLCADKPPRLAFCARGIVAARVLRWRVTAARVSRRGNRRHSGSATRGLAGRRESRVTVIRCLISRVAVPESPRLGICAGESPQLGIRGDRRGHTAPDGELRGFAAALPGFRFPESPLLAFRADASRRLAFRADKSPRFGIRGSWRRRSSNGIGAGRVMKVSPILQPRSRALRRSVFWKSPIKGGRLFPVMHAHHSGKPAESVRPFP